MQAIFDNSMDNPSTSTGMQNRHAEDVKGAQFIIQSNLKIMARSIAALSKMAEDLFIEIADIGMFLKVFNRSQSAYCVIRFAPEFFNNCDLSLINTKDPNICRISSKTAYAVFKGLYSGEKNFVDCEFRIDPKADKMAVKLNLAYDITREIQVNLLEMSRCLPKPVHDKSTFRNRTILFASILLPILIQMKNELEVTLVAEKEFLQIRNYPSSEMAFMLNMSELKRSRKVRTETKIAADKLTKHEVSFSVEISFSLREFLAVVMFAEQLGSEVCIYYETPGMPIIVAIEAHPNFDIELRLATPTDDDNFEIDGGILEQHRNQANLEHEGEASIAPVKNAAKSRKSKCYNIRVDQIEESSEKDSDQSVNKSTRAVSKNMSADRNVTEEDNEQTAGKLNATWRQNEMFNDLETQTLPRERNYDEEMEEIAPQEYQSIQCQEEMMEEEVMEQEPSNLDLRLENESNLCQRENADLGPTPPPCEEIQENVSNQKKRKTDEFDRDIPPRNVEIIPRNKRLRRILMGTRKGECGDDIMTQRMSQLFAGNEILVSDTPKY